MSIKYHLPVCLWNIATVPSANATSTRPFTCLRNRENMHSTWPFITGRSMNILFISTVHQNLQHANVMLWCVPKKLLLNIANWKIAVTGFVFWTTKNCWTYCHTYLMLNPNMYWYRTYTILSTESLSFTECRHFLHWATDECTYKLKQRRVVWIVCEIIPNYVQHITHYV